MKIKTAVIIIIIINVNPIDSPKTVVSLLSFGSRQFIKSFKILDNVVCDLLFS